MRRRHRKYRIPPCVADMARLFTYDSIELLDGVLHDDEADPQISPSMALRRLECRGILWISGRRVLHSALLGRAGCRVSALRIAVRLSI